MHKIFSIRLFLIILLLITIPITKGQAASVEELKQQSSSLSEQIRKLDQEILAVNKQLNSTKQEKQTLNSELLKLDTTRKKLLSELNLTSKKIEQANLNLIQLQNDITVKNRDIEDNKITIAEAIRQLREKEQSGLLEVFLSGQRLSEFISQTEDLNKLQSSLSDQINDLRANKQVLETKKTAKETEKKTLAGLKTQLSGQKQVVEETKKEKDQLLTVTKNKESNYQKLLNEKLERKKSVEAEMANIEQQIKIAIDPSLLPKTGSGSLLWPLAKVIITQYFGNTTFAQAHTAVYNGKGHNGIDLGTPIGTKVMAASAGVIKGAGDTDKTCQGASYGRWVLIEHTNGLSTLYAHLSVISVSEGQSVSAGQMIGLSGNTGYSTGPHLHFTVYASQGVKVNSLQSKVAGCGVYRLPIASYNSYLNPLDYLGK